MSKSKASAKQTDTQTQTINQTATQTPNTPDWLAQPYQQLTGQISNLIGSGQPLTAGASPLQQQAYSAASRLTGGDDYSQPQINGGGGDGYAGGKVASTPVAGMNGYNLGSILGLSAGLAPANLAGPAALAEAGQATTQGFSADELNKRLSPYLKDVVDTSLADYDIGAGRQQAQAQLQASKNGGFYNSINAARDAILAGELTRGRASTAANLRDQGFGRASDILTSDNNRAAQVSMSNAANATQAALANAAAQNQNSFFNAGQQDNALARQLQAAGLLPQIATAQGQMGLAQNADTRANIGLQADLGNQQRDIANSQTEAARIAQLQALLSGVNPNLFVGQTAQTNGTTSGTGTRESTSSQSGLMGILGGLGTLGLGLGQMGWQPFGAR